MAISTVLSVLSASSYLPGYLYNYFMGNSLKSELNGEDFEYVMGDEEERAKIMELADKIFISTSEDTVMYDYDTLMKGGTIRGDNPFPFKRFQETDYTRTCLQIGPLFKNASNYQKVLSEHIIQKYYGNRGLTPMRSLQSRLAEQDPIALQISAMLFQLGDDAEMRPSVPDDDYSFLDERAVAVPYETGQINLQRLDQFTIKNDRISIIDKTGTVIGGYKVDRTVTIGYPNADGSVECRITRSFERIYPVSNA